MIQYEDRCCGCGVPPCLGSSCPNKNIEVHYCDKCGEELYDIYEVFGQELCEECLKDEFRIER